MIFLSFLKYCTFGHFQMNFFLQFFILPQASFMINPIQNLKVVSSKNFSVQMPLQSFYSTQLSNLDPQILRSFDNQCLSFIFRCASISWNHVGHWVINVFKISRLESIREYCRVLQNITEYNRVLQSVTEFYIVLQSATECNRVLQNVRGC